MSTPVRSRRYALGAAVASVVGLLSLGPMAGPAQAARVCIPFLSGTQCVQFLEGRPTKPGLSKGMRITVDPPELNANNELVVSIKGFQPNEGLRRFNYNIFGQGRMNEYGGDFRRADRKGNFTWTIGPSTAVYEPSWGPPAVCVYGQRSKRLACANFTVAADGSTTPAQPAAPDPGQNVPAPNPAPAQPAQPAQPTPASGGQVGPGCIDAGFTVICSG